MTTRQLRISILVALAALLVGLWLWLRPSRRFRLVVTVSPQKVGVGARAEVEVHVHPASAARGMTFTWSSSRGTVVAAGSKAHFTAPMEAGSAEIKVVGEAAGQQEVAVVQVPIATYRSPARPDAPPDETIASGEFAGGYKLGEIELDRTRLCKNDELRVTVHPTDPGGESGWLTARVTMGHQYRLGTDVVLPVSADAATGSTDVQVELLDTRYASTVVASKTVKIPVEDCRVPTGGLWVGCKPGVYEPGTIECHATPTALDAPLPWRPVRFEWTVLTDPHGTYPITTQVPMVRWPLPLPLADQAQLQHVVAVKAVGPEGQVLEARGSVSLENIYYLQKFQVGQLLLLTQFGPPVPMGKDMQVQVSLANPYEEAVSLDRVELSFASCSPDARPWQGPRGSEPPGGNVKLEWKAQPAVTAAQAVGSARLEPGQRVRFTWKLPRDSSRCDARADLHGKGAVSGLEARATWLMPTGPQAMLPPDPARARRLRMAMEILRKRQNNPGGPLVIGPQDLADLEAEGLIPAEDAPLPPGEAPPPR